jgi:hypothetical protein
VPGVYEVSIEAALGDHDGSTASARLEVEVVPSGARDRPVIYAPASDPVIVEPDSDASVVFKVAVAGMANPPESLALEELTEDGDFQEIGELRDDGPEGGGPTRSLATSSTPAAPRPEASTLRPNGRRRSGRAGPWTVRRSAPRPTSSKSPVATSRPSWSRRSTRFR